MKKILISAVALMIAAGAAHASSVTYDFKFEANKNNDPDRAGLIGEAIFSEFNTSGNSVFLGPNLKVTAKKGGADAFVYFDNGDAGMGVCGSGFADGSGGVTGLNSYNPGSGANLCDPSTDDGLTAVDETLYFTATSGKMIIQSFLINSNHDTKVVNGVLQSIIETAWNINGVEYDVSDLGLVKAANGDVKIDVNFLLKQGETFSLFGTEGPNSYISAIAVSAVPLPATGLMLLAGLGGLGALRARKKAA